MTDRLHHFELKVVAKLDEKTIDTSKQVATIYVAGSSPNPFDGYVYAMEVDKINGEKEVIVNLRSSINHGTNIKRFIRDYVKTFYHKVTSYQVKNDDNKLLTMVDFKK